MSAKGRVWPWRTNYTFHGDGCTVQCTRRGYASQRVFPRPAWTPPPAQRSSTCTLAIHSKPLLILKLYLGRWTHSYSTSHSAYVAMSTESNAVKIDGLLCTTNFFVDSENVSEKFLHRRSSQCARMELNKRSLPKPTTTAGWKLIPHRSKITMN